MAALLVLSSTAPAVPLPTLDPKGQPTFAAGGMHSLAIKSDGSLWAWGNNQQGQLGNGASGAGQELHVPTHVGGDAEWATVAAGFDHSLGIQADGTLWAWGDNAAGELGDGTGVDRSSPTQIGTDTHWVAVSASSHHSLAIKSDGTLWAWGDNRCGQLGDGTTQDRHAPTRVGNKADWVAVATGDAHSLGIRSDGSLWAWGMNGSGRLGDGTNVNHLTPTRIGEDDDWVAVAAGTYHSLGLRANGSLWAWGGNDFGKLGDGTTEDRYVPTRIGTETGWVGLSAGVSYSLGLRADGSLWAWGWNGAGQLGDGTTEDRHQPTRVGMASSWLAVSAGGSHSLGLRSGGGLGAWGVNSFGRLGDGTTEDRDQPVQVLAGVRVPATATTSSSSTTSSSTTSSSTTTTTVPHATTFSDVAGSPYEDAIYYLAGEGIVGGYPDGTFRPNNPVTRQQFAKTIVLTIGYPVSSADICPFVDVTKSVPGSYVDPTDPNYPDHYVAVCAARGITQGKTADTFAPYDQITRQQLITMITRAAGLSTPLPGYMPIFSREQFSLEEHYLNACKAHYHGLLNGLPGVGASYNFLASASRGECAQLLYNLAQLGP